MNRYKYTKQKYTTTGKIAYKSTIYPEIGFSPSDILIMSVDGDRLDLLAYKYYKDVSKWWIIAQANNLGKGSMIVPPGMNLIIPTDVDLIEMNLEANQKL